jgi:hypothetical protein
MNMSAADAHYAQLLRSISESQARTEASQAARKAGATKYWYFIHEDYCPVCGRSDTARERAYTPKPDNWEDRHAYHESYDWCEG